MYPSSMLELEGTTTFNYVYVQLPFLAAYICPIGFHGFRDHYAHHFQFSPFFRKTAARQPGAQPATTPPSSAFNLTSQLVELPLLQVRVLVQMDALLNNFIYINSHFKSQSQESYTLMTNDILGGFF